MNLDRSGKTSIGTKPDCIGRIEETEVDNFNHLLNQFLQLILLVGNVLVTGIIAVQTWLRGALASFGVPEQVQSVVLVVVAVLLVLTCLRLFGGLIRLAILLLLVLVAVHFVAPMLPAPR
jgi:hypothetical protein